MKDTENLHLKVQELCDCFSTTDLLKEMSEIEKGENALSNPDVALKWLALAVLHGVNSNARKISLKQDGDGIVSVTAEYRETDLPTPGSGVANNVFEAIRDITHIEDDKGKTRLALGIKDSSLDLEISVKDKENRKKLSIKFP